MSKNVYEKANSVVVELTKLLLQCPDDKNALQTLCTITMEDPKVIEIYKNALMKLYIKAEGIQEAIRNTLEDDRA